MQTKPNDAAWLKAAAQLGLRGRPSSTPNPCVGVIIVKDGVVAGRGWTQPGGRPHGEAMAISQAGSRARGATLYTSLEPCAHPSRRGPTCSDLITEAGIARVVFGMLDPDPRTAGAGANMLRRAGISVDQLKCSASIESLKGYLMQRMQQRPHVTVKLAMSLDGFAALPSGESQWITGEAARSHVHSRRAMTDAILVGGGTWRADKPRLNVRLPGLEYLSPQRIILTRGIAPDGVKVINTPEQIRTLTGLHYLYIEGGPQTAASFLAAGLVDQIEIYRAPIILGSGLPAFTEYGLSDLLDAHDKWALTERRMLGRDTYEAYEYINATGAAHAAPTGE